MTKKEPLLKVENLSVAFRMYERGMKQRNVKVISDLSVQAFPGEILAIAGSSGSGKSLLAHAVMGLLPGNAAVTGAMCYQGAPLTEERKKELRGREIALIPQSVTWLDPLMRVGRQAEGHRRIEGLAARRQAVFDQLGLEPETARLFPFQLSGGMARRVLFSTAILAEAKLIIADEPTPGMHVSQAMEALSILRQLADAGAGVVLITHDIDLAVQFADRIAVFYAGTTMEEALAADFVAGPDSLRHPYSKALWQALPQHGFVAVKGQQPFTEALPKGCLFAPRCERKSAACEATVPPMQALRGGWVRCFHGT